MNKYHKFKIINHKIRIVILIILGILIIANNVSASEIATIYTEGDIQGQSGQTVNIKIMASGMNDVGTVAIALVFDNSVLSVSSVTDGNIKTPDAFSTSNVNNAQGLVAMGLGNPKGINGDGTLFTITFKIIGNIGSSSNLKLSLTANDIASNVIDTSTTKIISGKFTVVGEGGTGLMEPYDNIVKYEVKERSVSGTPITFSYSIPEITIYEIVLTSKQTGVALLRVDALKDTSKLVGSPAPGIVYKNLNIWIDYRRVNNAIIRYKVENSWISDNGLTDDKIKMSKWDGNNKRWIDLTTNKINKDDAYTYFESQTESIPASFAIHTNKEKENVVPTPSETQMAQTPAVVTPVATQRPRPSFEIGMLVYSSSFKSEDNPGSYAKILDTLISNNVTRIIVPIYDAKKGDNVHIFHADTKGLEVSGTDSYNLDTLLTEAHNRGMEVYLRVAGFGPDPVVPTEDQKQNLKKIVNHILTNYADDKGNRVDGIFLDHVYYESPLSAEGNTDIMANVVRDLFNEIKGRAKLSVSVKPAYYESLIHVDMWPHRWPVGGPSDYYAVTQYEGQDYAKLSKNLDFISPVTYNDDHNYVGKVAKFIKERAGENVNVIPNIQAHGATTDSIIQYAIESAKNNGAKGVNIFDYSTMSDGEWNIVKNIK